MLPSSDLPEFKIIGGQIDWAVLLPPDNVTRWLALDEVGKRIQIEPSAAGPDWI